MLEIVIVIMSLEIIVVLVVIEIITVDTITEINNTMLEMRMAIISLEVVIVAAMIEIRTVLIKLIITKTKIAIVTIETVLGIVIVSRTIIELKHIKKNRSNKGSSNRNKSVVTQALSGRSVGRSGSCMRSSDGRVPKTGGLLSMWALGLGFRVI